MEEEGRAVRCQLMIVERALQNISGSEGYEAESKEPLFIGTANISKPGRIKGSMMNRKKES